MGQFIYEQYSAEELQSILNNSSSIKDFGLKLGYASVSGATSKQLKNIISELQLQKNFKDRVFIQRNPDNIFIKNSTASQKILRKYYILGEYTPYVCSICGQKPEWQGKPLTLILDHINGDNRDDRLENLRWVCPNCNQQLDTTGAKNRKNKKYKNHCHNCGKEITRGSYYCFECNCQIRSKKSIESQIDRQTLKNKIRKQSFESIAKEYNKTSGNAIKKWCDYFGLPRLKSEIKKYSDEEWNAL